MLTAGSLEAGTGPRLGLVKLELPRLADPPRISLCFVCLGNICRSPTAEGIFLQRVAHEGLSDAFHIDSAGTSGAHAGAPADARSRFTAETHGVSLPSRSRPVSGADFARFDLIIPMDSANLAYLERLRPEGAHAQLYRLLDFSTDMPFDDVPDPYYGGQDGFDKVFRICTSGCNGLFEALRPYLAAPKEN